ncbi:MAG: anti-sigma factor [Bacteroidia bacterium]
MKKIGLFLVAFTLFFTACKDEDTNPTGMLTVDISGLEDLGPDAIYEGWMIVDGAPVTTGTFTVDANGNMSTTTFTVNAKGLKDATRFVLTIEPQPDPSPSPSAVHIVAGDFSDDNASLTIGHGSALGSDFSSAAGKYILATPTDTSSSNEESGIWFLDNSSGSPAVGLSLPVLPNGWKYEGWTVINGTPVSTGTFTSVNMADEGAPFSGTMSGPPFPGEDFLNNAPSGLTFPTDIRGGKAVISIEPNPDNSPMPFVLKPLVGDIDANAATHTALDMGQNLSFPTGSASR